MYTDPHTKLMNAVDLSRIREDSAWQRFYGPLFGQDVPKMRVCMEIYLSIASERERAEKRLQEFEAEMEGRAQRLIKQGA